MFLQHLSAYVDDELPPANNREMEAHLLVCSNCAHIYKLYRSASSVIQDDIKEPPAALSDIVMERVHSDGARIDNRSSKATRRKALLVRYAPLAACLVLALVALPFVIPFFFGRDEAVGDLGNMYASPIAEVAEEAVAVAPATTDAGYVELFDRDHADVLYDDSVEAGAGDLWSYRWDGYLFDTELDNEVFEQFAQGDFTLTPYYRTIILTGPIPQILLSYEPSDAFEPLIDGQLFFVIPGSSALMLLDELDDMQNVYISPQIGTGTQVLVVVNP